MPDISPTPTVSPLAAAPRVAALLADAQPGDAATARGWVRTRRDSKAGITFVELNDGSCLSNLQIVLPHDLPDFATRAAPITTGASLVVAGEIVESRGKQRIELRAADFAVPGAADPEKYPLQKKRHSFEYLREIAHLRPRSNTFGAVARVRNRLSYEVHRFFQDRGFLYVHTPIISTNDCEGAGEVFAVTTQPNGGDPAEDFFSKRAGLTVSGQLEAEVYATSVGDCYTFGPTFRAENSNTPRHLAEFWMIEPEMPFCDLEGNMDLAEAFVKALVAAAQTDCEEDMNFFGQRIDKMLPDTLRTIAEKEFVRLPYTDAVDLLKGSGQAFEYPVEWGQDLQTEHERFLTETHFKSPVIVHDYPASHQAVLYAGERARRRGPGDGAGDGRAGPASRRDRRRQPAGGPPGRAGPADGGPGHRPGKPVVVRRAAGLRHGPAQRVRAGVGAGGPAGHGNGKRAGRHPVPADPGARGVLSGGVYSEAHPENDMQQAQTIAPVDAREAYRTACDFIRELGSDQIEGPFRLEAVRPTPRPGARDDVIDDDGQVWRVVVSYPVPATPGSSAWIRAEMLGTEGETFETIFRAVLVDPRGGGVLAVLPASPYSED